MGRCKGYKTSYNKKGTAIYNKTSYYCQACKQFCHPECLNFLHKKHLNQKIKLFLTLKKTLDMEDLMLFKHSSKLIVVTYAILSII